MNVNSFADSGGMLVHMQHSALPLKLAFGSLKDILSEVFLRFDEHGLTISGLDPQKVGAVSLSIRKTNVYSFRGDSSIVMGVHIKLLYHMLRGVSKTTEVEFLVDKCDPQFLLVRLINEKSVRHHRIRSLTMDTIPEPVIIPSDFETIVQVFSVDLYRAVRDLGSRPCEIGFKMTNHNDYLTLLSQDEVHGLSTVTIKNTTVTDVFGVSASKQAKCVENMFVAKYIQKFTKTTLASVVMVGLKQDYPLVLHYIIDDNVAIKIAVAPIRQT